MGTAEALGGGFEDQHGDAIRIGGDIVIPDAQDPPTLRFEKRCAAIVIGQLIKMLAAVEFDRELRLAAREIDNI